MVCDIRLHMIKKSTVKSLKISRIKVDIKIVDHSVTQTLFLLFNLATGFNGLGKGSCKTKREIFKFLWLILQV